MLAFCAEALWQRKPTAKAVPTVNWFPNDTYVKNEISESDTGAVCHSLRKLVKDSPLR
jgi:hypothetical protein